MNKKSKWLGFFTTSLVILSMVFIGNNSAKAAEVQHGFSISEFVTKKESLELVMTGLNGKDIYNIFGICCTVLCIGLMIYVKIKEKNDKNK
ncbi:Uncharacterised protein [Granulicatella adiacens]|mgnify:FL=1|jgi:hypothetical protein|uniref:hypothetical protein n=1 Tax=Granulicatella TaxID=117563 RepID=UPI0008A455D2|nr:MULTISPECIES: hypothetical protein [Granulicatella]MCT2160724.1 hypothetical protein [Granulicatella adiacens]OFT79849.1 hypothetical protein HMPREF3103_05135 [Granulicatella sp. HMSC30F09]UXY42176.1 hypothetical protein N8I82_04085 [Granulicatella adiacens]VTX71925.1 Uncharacterised protein [Granulicatella adiacens]